MSVVSKVRLAHVALATILTVAGTGVFAQAGQPTAAQPTAAQRKLMSERHKAIAGMHLKMATCLDSTRSFDECRQEMIDSCTNNFNGACPMMGPGQMRGGGKGMMGGGNYWHWMMNPVDGSEPKSEPQKK